VSFFKRLFSADYRAAVAAEAAGDLELAAERYALAGQKEGAVRVHLARAERAGSRKGEIAALRDAHHWADEDPGLRAQVSRRLGEALLAQAKAEGVATARDHERVREAAALLSRGRAHRAAGEAYESIGDDEAAAAAYRAGGLVDQMEEALLREQERGEAERAVKDAFADYEVAIRGGDRDAAVRALRRAVDVTEHKTEYRRMLDELEARLITGGRVVLVTGKGERITVFAGDRLLIGRDPLCDYVLRSGGISRRHSEIAVTGEGDAVGFVLADAGSRNGTRVAGIPLAGSVPLEDEGRFELGDHCTVDYAVAGEPPVLTLSVAAGLDAGSTVRATSPGTPIDLADLGLPVRVYFHDGRPMLQHPGRDIVLSGHRIVHGDTQLIHGDTLSIEGIEVEVV
jgi:tetratricopeptide (TPR) repeat protein